MQHSFSEEHQKKIQQFSTLIKRNHKISVNNKMQCNGKYQNFFSFSSLHRMHQGEVYVKKYLCSLYIFLVSWLPQKLSTVLLVFYVNYMNTKGLKINIFFHAIAPLWWLLCAVVRQKLHISFFPLPHSFFWGSKSVKSC